MLDGILKIVVKKLSEMDKGSKKYKKEEEKIKETLKELQTVKKYHKNLLDSE